ncbi:class I SAM-dependent methyltransferase [Novibacillus thermophilus]|jgi:ubiquinone/menaquinone biosynthesis C-methylase UbiE|nr:methyltransferase domain-containing protein [Novibacillus thermophilus]
MAGHRFKPEHVQKLHDPKRVQLLPQEEIIRNLCIAPGDRVADLGAGSGYFTLPIAKATQTNVYAVDIEPKMLDELKRRAAAANIHHIQSVVSDLEDIPLKDDSVDKVMAAFVLHEVGNLSNALQEMKRILKPGGRGLVLEWEAVDTDVGPPVADRLPSAQLEQTLRRHGFDTVLTHPHEAYYVVQFTLAKGGENDALYGRHEKPDQTH